MHITRAPQSAEMLLSNKGNATQSSSKENLMSGKTPAFIIAGIVIVGAVIMTFVLTTGQKKTGKKMQTNRIGIKSKSDLQTKYG